MFHTKNSQPYYFILIIIFFFYFFSISETGRKGPGHPGCGLVWARCEQFVVTHQPGVAGGADELERKDLAGTHMVSPLVNKS